MPTTVLAGTPPPFPVVTMRLETPVIYFYPPNEAVDPLTVDVHVGFRGGWLSQFYPHADVSAPGFEERRIGSETVGTLHWQRLRIGGSDSGPQTDAQVWLAPRQVRSASVGTPEGETERYLFYRGVGHLDSPLRVVREDDGSTLMLYSNLPSTFPTAEALVIPRLWLADIRPDGSCAMRTVSGVRLTRDGTRALASIPAAFGEETYSAEQSAELRRQMHHGLMEEGLFADEAEAMLKTWEVSYFTSPGLRLFYLVPGAWADYHLPLTVSVPSRMTRVMVGRIELVSPQQRQLIRQIAESPVPAGAPDQDVEAAYQRLGRFRDALLLDELERRPTAGLAARVELYGATQARMVKGIVVPIEPRSRPAHGTMAVE